MWNPLSAVPSSVWFAILIAISIAVAVEAHRRYKRAERGPQTAYGLEKPTLKSSGSVVGVYFGLGTLKQRPLDTDPEVALIKLIDDAILSLEVAIYTFTSMPLMDALIRARHRGLIVTVVVDSHQANLPSSQKVLKTLSEGGCTVKLTTKQHSLMHNKVLIVDMRIVATGSFNWTAQAHKLNDENLVIIEGGTIAADFQTYIFDRIIGTETMPYPPTDEKLEGVTWNHG